MDVSTPTLEPGCHTWSGGMDTTFAGLSIDLEMPDEEVAIVDVDATANPHGVRAAVLAVAEAQRAKRLQRLEAHGLGLDQHSLKDAGPMSPTLLGSMRVLMLTGAELRDIPEEANPMEGPLSEPSERRMCEALQAILRGLLADAASETGDAAGDYQRSVLLHSLTALAELEGQLPHRSQQRKRGRSDTVEAAEDSERRSIERELHLVLRQRAALEQEELRLRERLRQLSSSSAQSGARAEVQSSPLEPRAAPVYDAHFPIPKRHPCMT